MVTPSKRKAALDEQTSEHLDTLAENSKMVLKDVIRSNTTNEKIRNDIKKISSRLDVLERYSSNPLSNNQRFANAL